MDRHTHPHQYPEKTSYQNLLAKYLANLEIDGKKLKLVLVYWPKLHSTLNDFGPALTLFLSHFFQVLQKTNLLINQVSAIIQKWLSTLHLILAVTILKNLVLQSYQFNNITIQQYNNFLSRNLLLYQIQSFGLKNR